MASFHDSQRDIHIFRMLFSEHLTHDSSLAPTAIGAGSHTRPAGQTSPLVGSARPPSSPLAPQDPSIRFAPQASRLTLPFPSSLTLSPLRPLGWPPYVAKLTGTTCDRGHSTPALGAFVKPYDTHKRKGHIGRSGSCKVVRWSTYGRAHGLRRAARQIAMLLSSHHKSWTTQLTHGQTILTCAIGKPASLHHVGRAIHRVWFGACFGKGSPSLVEGLLYL